jgi:predicted dehydrogenase
VLGVDLDSAKVELARTLGLDEGVVSSENDPRAAAEHFSKGRGVDHVLITAATDSSGPVELAGAISRRKGTVVAVGNVGLDVPRDVFYEKEIELHVSMSYGPGRYDASYEEGGTDYPFEYVRWTEQRNMQAVLDLMGQGALDVGALTTHSFSFDDALDAYDLIRSEREAFVGVVLTYDLEAPQPRILKTRATSGASSSGALRIGCIGAGNYATRFLLPHLQDLSDTELLGLATATGPSAEKKANKFGFQYCTTEADAVITDENVDAVVIATRHSTHAEFSIRALNAGKHVFVEKPMVVSEGELERVMGAYEAANEQRPTGFMVGLNRRFAPMIKSLRDGVSGAGALQMLYRVNSGPIPTDSWLHRPEEGGGMLVGEMVHFIDLMQFVCDERPSEVYAQNVQVGTAQLADHDNVAITVTFDGGSIGTLCYNTIGDKAAAKERLEVYGGGVAITLEDFRRLEITKDGSTSRSKAWNQDKGQEEQMRETVSSFRTRRTGPIPFDELVVGMQSVFAARRALAEGVPIAVPQYELVDAPA